MGLSRVCPVCSFRLFGFSFFSFFFAFLLQSTTGRELRSVIAVFRHGDRSPISTFPTNVVKEDAWTQGYGQLTKLGMQQQYELGQFIKKRYGHLLSDEYKHHEVYVQSTDYDRTIMSAQANLAGLFPPRGRQIWNPKLLWQPVPVHTRPLSDETLLLYPTRDCKRFLLLLKETMGTKQVQAELQSYMKFLNRMASNMGYDIKTLLDFTNQKLWNAYDALLVQKIHKLPVPYWAGAHAMARLQKLLAYAVNGMFGIHKREEKARMQGGVLVKAILEKFLNVTKLNRKIKLTMFSAHDMTLVALQVALDVFNLQLPPYAACHFFELYKEVGGEHTIEMYYRNSSTVDPHPLILPGCSHACPLKKFEDLVAPVLAHNAEESCNM
uniref:acid phosphatase n=1 Tax=Pogona vitticeps TaxID=103695 RepID=A0A6J0UPZ1_9SAUR